MEIKDIEISDKDKVEKIRGEYGYNTAAYTFASFFIWSEQLGFKLYIKDDMFSVLCEKFGCNTWTFPCGGEEEKIRFISDNVKNTDFNMIYLREEDKIFLEDRFPGVFDINEREEYNEYIYDRDAWEALEGKKYASMRNHIRRVLKDNEVNVERITCENIEKVHGIIDSWDSYRTDLGSLGDTDKIATTKLIEYYRELNEDGILVYVNKEPMAVVAGFPISEDMFDMCLAKQKEIIPGLSVYAKYMFVKELDKKYRIINAEDDLGIEGLRNMKKQMQPIGQIKCYEAKLACR